MAVCQDPHQVADSVCLGAWMHAGVRRLRWCQAALIVQRIWASSNYTASHTDWTLISSSALWRHYIIIRLLLCSCVFMHLFLVFSSALTNFDFVLLFSFIICHLWFWLWVHNLSRLSQWNAKHSLFQLLKCDLLCFYIFIMLKIFGFGLLGGQNTFF